LPSLHLVLVHLTIIFPTILPPVPRTASDHNQNITTLCDLCSHPEPRPSPLQKYGKTPTSRSLTSISRLHGGRTLSNEPPIRSCELCYEPASSWLGQVGSQITAHALFPSSYEFDANYAPTAVVSAYSRSDSNQRSGESLLGKRKVS
jgi:hypothetical protein